MEHRYYYNHYSNQEQFYNLCTHKKKLGTLIVQNKKIYFTSLDTQISISIVLTEITDAEVESNEKGELIKITTIDKSFVFRFSSLSEQELKLVSEKKMNLIEKLSKKDARNKLYDLIKTINCNENENLLKECFIKKLSEDKQFEISNILKNRYLMSLFNELCLKNILKYDEFSKFIRKKYNMEYLQGLFVNQNINLARSDELFLTQPGIIRFDSDKIKKKLTHSIIEFIPSASTHEKEAWIKFLDRQLVNKTLLSGGFKPISFDRTNECIQPIKKFYNHNTSFNICSYTNLPFSRNNYSLNAMSNPKEEITNTINLSFNHIQLSNFKSYVNGGFKLNNEFDYSVESLKSSTDTYSITNSNINLTSTFNVSSNLINKEINKEKELKIHLLIKDINNYSKNKISNFKENIQESLLFNNVKPFYSSSYNLSKKKDTNKRKYKTSIDTKSRISLQPFFYKFFFSISNNSSISREMQSYLTNLTSSTYLKNIIDLSFDKYKNINKISNQLKKLSSKIEIESNLIRKEDFNVIWELKTIISLFRDLICIILNLKNIKISEEEKSIKTTNINKIYKGLKERIKKIKDEIDIHPKYIHTYINNAMSSVSSQYKSYNN